MGDESWLNAVHILINGDNNEVIFGERVTINASTMQPTIINACYGTKIKIGQDSLLSNNIEIHSTDYHCIYDAAGKRINPDADIELGNHVWIGLGTKILKGTFIANNSMVGAGSIVSGNIDEPNSMIAGVPAKIIKRNIRWEK